MTIDRKCACIPGQIMSLPRIQINPNNDYSFYIRRSGLNGWSPACSHHKTALLSFLEHPSSQTINAEAICISVPHIDGGVFVAWFQKKNKSIYQYRDEYDNIVDIMMACSSNASHINSIVNHY